MDVSTAFSACLGGALPDYIAPYNEDALTWLLSEKKVSEIKVAVISAQDIPANITTMRAIA
eukprot:6719852-Ditylum_brightwellii.AAC.1